MGRHSRKVTVVHPALNNVWLNAMHDLPELPDRCYRARRRGDIEHADRNARRYEIVGILAAATQADDMLRQAKMLQSYCSFHEHAFGPAKPETADHMQDRYHFLPPYDRRNSHARQHA